MSRYLMEENTSSAEASYSRAFTARLDDSSLCRGEGGNTESGGRRGERTDKERGQEEEVAMVLVPLVTSSLLKPKA